MHQTTQKVTCKRNIPAQAQALCEKAIQIANTYLNAESQLISVFQELHQTKAYLHFEVTSLNALGIEVLKLSEGATANIITVALKSVKFPELKAAVESGEVTINKARRIASVITKDNQDELIALAKVSTSRVIEKEVARLNPQLAVPEKLKYRTAERLELSFGISEALSVKFKRVKDLLAQKKSKPISSEEA